MRQATGLALALLLVACGDNRPMFGAFALGEATCGLNESFMHATRSDGNREVLHGEGAVVFLSDYAVNTDGAPNSYHPDDPYGSQGLAINTVCNGAHAITADGERVDYAQCGRLAQLFEEARDGDWLPEGGPRVQFYGVATVGPSGDEAHRPCINDQAPYEGYMVSATSLIADPSRDRCDQARYINALTTPSIIVPGHSNFAATGASVGDLAVVHHPESGRTLFAIVGDRGPSWGLGEGSVYIGRGLNGSDANPTRRSDIYGVAASNVMTLIMPGERMDPPYTQTRITEAGRSAFARFGGMRRLEACAGELGE